MSRVRGFTLLEIFALVAIVAIVVSALFFGGPQLADRFALSFP